MKGAGDFKLAAVIVIFLGAVERTTFWGDFGLTQIWQTKSVRGQQKAFAAVSDSGVLAAVPGYSLGRYTPVGMGR